MINIFIGNFYSKEIIEEYGNENILSIGNDKYERNFISILSKMNDDLQCFSLPALPVVNKKTIKTSSFQDGIYYYCGFIYKKQNVLCKRKKIFWNFIKHNLKKSDSYCFFISTYHNATLVDYIRKAFPNEKIVLLLPDLPNIYFKNYTKLYKIRMTIISTIIKHKLNFYDLIMPITPNKSNFLSKYKGKIYVYENYFDCDLIERFEKINAKKILYAGNIDREYGVLEMIDAFKKSKASKYFNLIICGNGDCKNILISISKENKNIKYLGSIPHNDVLKLERECSLLIVPDKQNRPFSFHSRMLEYIASSTPVLCYLPAGIKQEYVSFLNIINNDTALEDAIDNVLLCNYEKAIANARNGSEYLKKNKNALKFAKEIKNILYN